MDKEKKGISFETGNIQGWLKNAVVGEERFFEVEKLPYLSAIASKWGKIYGRKYTVRTNWEKRIITVSRER